MLGAKALPGRMMRLSDKAFTLIELLLASTILAFVLSGLLALFCSVIAMNEANRSQFSALSHAEFVMEDIKNTTFSNIATNIQNGNWDWDSSAIISQGLVPLSTEQIDTSVSGSSVLNTTVAVSWMDKGNRARNFSLSTKIVSP